MINLFSVTTTVTNSNTQPFSQNAIDLILNAGIVAQIVLAILGFFSIISWGIILDKIRVFGKVRRQSDRFLHFFDQGKSARDILQASREFPANPFATVFKEAFMAFSRNDASQSGRVESTDTFSQNYQARNHKSEDLVRLFDSVASREVLALEKNLSFLATTGSVSPFFGLFGTVWGVMNAFLAIGLTGSADLSVVAPGIAEALITTVAGLGAAIPAVMGYNYFVNKLKHLSAELEIFYANLIEAFTRKEVHEVK